MAAEISKPDFSYQWSSGGSIVAPSNSKIQTGWTAEVPPFQWENWSQNRQDNAILHLFQKGISEWDAASNYYFTASGVRSYVQGSDGLIYVAVQDNIGQDPTTDSTDTYWKVAFIDSTILTAAINISSPVVGESRNVRAVVSAAAATATFTADEIVVATTLTGARYKLSSFSKSINLATTGAGGMDTGSAPVNGYVAVYVIYNPTTLTSALLGVNATATRQPEIYGGVNMPSGYTSSALLSVWPTNVSSQFKIGSQIGRRISFQVISVLSSAVPTGLAPLSIAAAVPLNAVSVRGDMGASSTASSNLTMFVFSDANSVGRQFTSGGPGTGMSGDYELDLTAGQSIYYIAGSTAGVPTLTINVSSYGI